LSATREITWPVKKREEYEASFARERLVIAGFPDRLLMTLQKFFSDNPPSKSPFHQSPPHPPGYHSG
jgi:hypothetical protein